MDTRQELLSFDSNCESPITKLHDICNWEQLDDVAIEYHDLQETIYIQYRELHLAKNQISDYLKSLRNTEFIGINSDIPGYCVIPLMLGILNSEHTFVNLPSSTTGLNFKNVLNIQYLFCKNVNIEGETLHQFTIHRESIYLIKLTDVKKQVRRTDIQNNYAYAISTSGSTGTPKIVRVLHSCIVPNILDLSRILSITKFDKICQLTNFTFDPSLIEIFLALSNGATLFMVSNELKNNPNRFLREAHSSQITVLQVTPSVFMYNWSPECLKTTILSNDTKLRVILFGGEPFPKVELFSEARQPCNTTKMYNIYGITEVSCWSSITEVNFANEHFDPHYLGQTLSCTMFQVRNETEEVITDGIGSLYIGSNQRICLVDDEDIKDLELPIFRDSGDVVSIHEGKVFYKGRKNNIIKRFGNKIDLSQIERSVLQIDFVKNCYVMWDQNCHRLHLCFSAKDNIKNGRNLNIELMEHLHKLDPLYRPDKIHFLEHVELTSSSKISLDFLQEQVTKDIDNSDLQRIESTFKSIWESNLQRGNSSFMKLGGTSVIALQLSNAMSDMLQMEFPRLISMLLMDASIDECLSYIKGVVLNSNDYFDNTREELLTTILSIEDTGSLKNLQMKFADKQDDNSKIPSNETYNCQWYKCRGQLYTNTVSINEKYKLQYDEITRVKVLKKYDTEKCVDASPTVFRYSNGKTYATVGSHSGLIFTFELGSDSNSVFRIKLPDRIESSVLVLDDFRGVVGCYDCNIYCLNLKTGETIWVHRTGDVVKGTAVLCNKKEILFIGSYDSCIYCLSVKDGSEVWKFKTGNGSIYATGCLHYPSNTVLFGTLDGSCLALQQSTGKLIWKYKLSDPIFVAPLWLNDGLVLFCSVTGLLCCFDIEVNVKMWAYKINGNVFSYLLKQIDTSTKCETIIITSQNKNVYCLLSDTNFKTEPILKCVLNFHSPIFATPWCEDNFLFIACTDGTLNIYNFNKNTLMKIEELPGEVFSSPVIDGDKVIIGCRDNYIYILELI